MKKRAFVLLALALGGGMACAQFGSVPMPYLVTGDELFGVNVGTAYVRPVLSADASDIRQGVPVAVSFRYDSERAVGTHWVVGFQAELGYLRSRMAYRLDGDSHPYEMSNDVPGHWLHYDSRTWTTSVDLRFHAGYYITEQVEPFLAVGLYENLLAGKFSSLTLTNKSTGQQEPPRTIEGKPSFDWDAGFSIAAGVAYYLNDNLYTMATAKVHIPFSWGRLSVVDGAAASGPQVYSFLVGIGYKFIN